MRADLAFRGLYAGSMTIVCVTTKVKRLARKSSLSYKAKGQDITILANFHFDSPKTRSYLNMLNSLAVADRKTLLILPAPDSNAVLAGRNLQQTKVVLAGEINTYDLLNADRLLICEGAVASIKQNLDR